MPQVFELHSRHVATSAVMLPAGINHAHNDMLLQYTGIAVANSISFSSHRWMSFAGRRCMHALKRIGTRQQRGEKSVVSVRLDSKRSLRQVRQYAWDAVSSLRLHARRRSKRGCSSIQAEQTPWLDRSPIASGLAFPFPLDGPAFEMKETADTSSFSHELSPYRLLSDPKLEIWFRREPVSSPVSTQALSNKQNPKSR